MYLNVYDLGRYMKVVNTVSRAFDWGIFHVGIEVYGREWCFERTFSIDVPGVAAYPPKQHPSHDYRESVLLGQTMQEPSEVTRLLRRLRHQWQGTSYHLLRRNCINFAEELARALGVASVPRWVRCAPDQGLRVLEDRLNLDVSSLLDEAPEHSNKESSNEPWLSPAITSTSVILNDQKSSPRVQVPETLSQSLTAPLSPIPEARTCASQRPADLLQRPLEEKLQSINRAQRKHQFLTLLFGKPEKEDESTTRAVTCQTKASNPTAQCSSPVHRQTSAAWSAVLGGDAASSSTTAAASPATPSTPSLWGGQVGNQSNSSLTSPVGTVVTPVINNKTSSLPVSPCISKAYPCTGKIPGRKGNAVLCSVDSLDLEIMRSITSSNVSDFSCHTSGQSTPLKVHN